MNDASPSLGQHMRLVERVMPRFRYRRWDALRSSLLFFLRIVLILVVWGAVLSVGYFRGERNADPLSDYSVALLIILSTAFAMTIVTELGDREVRLLPDRMEITQSVWRRQRVERDSIARIDDIAIASAKTRFALVAIELVSGKRLSIVLPLEGRDQLIRWADDGREVGS